MKNTKSILVILLVAIIASFSTSCKKDKTVTLNPNIEYHKVDTTLKSFFPQPTPSDRFEYIGRLPFEKKNLSVSVVLSWESNPDDLEFYAGGDYGEILDDGDYTKAMDANTIIDSTSSSWGTYSSISNDYVENPALPKGNLAGKGDKYVAFRVNTYEAQNEKYYGWAKVNVSADGRTIKIIEYAFSKIANVAIKTGDK